MSMTDLKSSIKISPPPGLLLLHKLHNLIPLKSSITDYGTAEFQKILK